MGAMSRRKGAAFEREVAHKIRTTWPNVHRTAPMQAGHAKRGYADLGGTPGFHVECGHGARMNATDKWTQASVAAALSDSPGAIAIAITKRNRGPIVVTLGIANFLALVSKARAWDAQAWDAQVAKWDPK